MMKTYLKYLYHEREHLYSLKDKLDEYEYKYKLRFIEFAILEQTHGIDIFINLKIIHNNRSKLKYIKNKDYYRKLFYNLLKSAYYLSNLLDLSKDHFLTQKEIHERNILEFKENIKVFFCTIITCGAKIV